jgi:predicted nucleic acid-binding protein
LRQRIQQQKTPVLRERAEPVNVHASFEISPDPKDDPFCLCSEEGNADFIVTLNPKDFPQERLRAKVISPGSHGVVCGAAAS